MADITGKSYETFIEFVLQCLGFKGEWSEEKEMQYLFGKHINALCHTDTKICPNAKACH